MPAPSVPTGFAVASAAIPVNEALRVSLRFSWNIVSADAEHDIEASENAGATWRRLATADVGASEWTIGGLKKVQTYSFRIRAQNGDGVSSYATITHTTAAVVDANTPPTAPSGLAASSVTGYGAVLTWTDNSANESNFIIELLRGDSVQDTRYLDPHVKTTRFDALIPNTTYRARVRGIGYWKNASGAYRSVFSAYSNEVVFTTGAPQIRITSPLVLNVVKDTAVTYTITTSPTATGWTIGALPAGLSHTSGVISGTPTSAGTTNVSVEVTDGATTDTRILVITVLQSNLRISSALSRTVAPGAAFSYTITATQDSGLPPATTFNAAPLPSWLALSGAVLSGTAPVSAAEYAITISAANAVQTVSQVLVITIPQIEITSAAEWNVTAGVPFDITPTALPANATWTLDDAPTWATVALVPSVGWRLRGTAPGDLAGQEVNMLLLAKVGIAQATQVLTLRIAGALQLEGNVDNVRASRTFRRRVKYVGAGTISSWEAVNQETPNNSSVFYASSGGTNIGLLTAALNAGAGYYYVEVVARMEDGSEHVLPISFEAVDVPTITDSYSYYYTYYNAATFTVPEDKLFDFRFTATNKPTEWACISDLPDNFTFDTATGRLTGSVISPRVFSLDFTATNAVGTSRPQRFNFAFTPVVGAVSRAVRLGWLHDDPTITDLQIDVRTGAVTSFYMLAGNILRFRQNQDMRLAVVLRDGDTILTALDDLRIGFRALNDYEAPFVLEDQTVTPVEFDTPAHVAFMLEIPVKGPALTTMFDALNKPQGPAVESREIELMADLLITLSGGIARGTDPIRAVITQAVTT